MALALLAACAPPRSPYYDSVTVLAAGEVTNGLPAFKLQSVLLRGDFGLLWDAEGRPVTVLTNGVFAWTGEGVPQPVRRDTLIGAGWITFFEADRTFDVADLDPALFGQALALKRNAPGLLEALRVTGAFDRLASVEKGEERDLQGTLMGFRAPPHLRGLQREEYRWWFFDARRQVLLRVRDFHLQAGRIEVDESNDLQVRLSPVPPPG